MIIKWLKASLTYAEVSSTDPLPVTLTTATLVAKGYVQMTSLGSATAFSSVPSDASYAVVTVESQAVRWRDDAVNPSATVGMPIAVGNSTTFNGRANILATKFFEQAGGAKLNVSYYG